VTKLVHGKGLCKKLTLGRRVEVNNEEEAVLILHNGQEENIDIPAPSWTQSTIHFLQISLFPLEMSK
ncbi:hypothetical protein KI387_032816, partial [Taxus chinensis]